MRCIACDRALSGTEMSSKKGNGEYEDLCKTCLFAAKGFPSYEWNCIKSDEGILGKDLPQPGDYD